MKLPCKECITYVLCKGENYNYEVPTFKDFINKCSLLRNFLLDRVENGYKQSIEVIYDQKLYKQEDSEDESGWHLVNAMREIEVGLEKENLIFDYFEGFGSCTGSMGGDPIELLINMLYYHKKEVRKQK